MKNEKQRQHFRLHYPNSYRPMLYMDLDEFEVEDVSETGLKVITGTDLSFMQNDWVLGTISFPDGREFGLGGQVIRMDNDYVCLQLDTPLPPAIIRSQALEVMYNYPDSQ